MLAYTLRAVHRRPDGVIGPTLYQRTIEAADDDAAVDQARALDLNLAAARANAIYLAAPASRFGAYMCPSEGRRTPAARYARPSPDPR